MRERRHHQPRAGRASQRAALMSAMLAFCLVTFDLVAVSIALPAIQREFDSRMAGLQWVVNAYAIMFGALLLGGGVVCDRIGARRALMVGVGAFAAAAMICALAPTLPVLLTARAAQGTAAALVMPASMALLEQSFRDPGQRARAVGLWALGASAASVGGPVIAGYATVVSWRLVFAVTVPVALVTLFVCLRAPASARRAVSFDLLGQLCAVLAIGSLIFAIIELGDQGATVAVVGVAAAIAVIATALFVLRQMRGRAPLLPLDVLRARMVAVPSGIGFAFMLVFFSIPFVMGLYLQQERELTAGQAGLSLLPMMVVGAILTPLGPRLALRFGSRLVIGTGFVVMASGLVVLALLPTSTPVWGIAAAMAWAGLGGPLISPPATAALLGAAPPDRAGTISGVFNVSRQLGAALGVAVCGVLISEPATFVPGMRWSMALGAVVAILAALLCRWLPGVPAPAGQPAGGW